MRETYQFRINERNASRYLPDDLGVRLGDSVRRVDISSDNPWFSKIRRVQCEFRARGDYFFLYWNVRRRYTEKELSEAPLLHMNNVTAMRWSGEQSDTEYDETGACSLCGAGAGQVTPLFLKISRIPSKSDIASSYADEIVVSARVVALFRDYGFTGARFDPVWARSRRRAEPSPNW